MVSSFWKIFDFLLYTTKITTFVDSVTPPQILKNDHCLIVIRNFNGFNIKKSFSEKFLLKNTRTRLEAAAENLF